MISATWSSRRSSPELVVNGSVLLGDTEQFPQALPNHFLQPRRPLEQALEFHETVEELLLERFAVILHFFRARVAARRQDVAFDRMSSSVAALQYHGTSL